MRRLPANLQLNTQPQSHSQSQSPSQSHSHSQSPSQSQSPSHRHSDAPWTGAPISVNSCELSPCHLLNKQIAHNRCVF